MLRRIGLHNVILCLFILSTTPARAESLISASEPEDILNIARGYGSAILSTDSTGDPIISGRIDGVQYVVFFYGCSDGKNCREIQFSSWWANDGSATEEMMHNWNKDYRFGTAYLDFEGDPTIKFSVNLVGGVSHVNLDNTFGVWAIALRGFKDYIN